MDSTDVMFGIVLLGFVLSGMTARAEYLGLRRGRKPLEKSHPIAVAGLHTAHRLSNWPGGPIRRFEKRLARCMSMPKLSLCRDRLRI
jgi:hypothetical protein